MDDRITEPHLTKIWSSYKLVTRLGSYVSTNYKYNVMSC